MDKVASPGSSALPVLSDTETELLRSLSEDGPLTVGQLMSLVESYRCRFPGLGMNQS
jgi:hypothetical protein